MTPIGRAPAPARAQCLDGGARAVMGMGSDQSASDLLVGWAFALVYTNVTAIPALLAGPVIVERLVLRRWPFPAAVLAATTLFVAMGCLAAQSLLMWTGVAVPGGLLAAVPAHDAGSVPAVGRVRTRRVLVRLDAGTSASQRGEAPRAGPRRRAGRAAGRRGSPAIARIAAPSALPVQHAELDQRAHHHRSPAGRPDRGPAVCAAFARRSTRARGR